MLLRGFLDPAREPAAAWPLCRGDADPGRHRLLSCPGDFGFLLRFWEGACPEDPAGQLVCAIVPCAASSLWSL